QQSRWRYLERLTKTGFLPRRGGNAPSRFDLTRIGRAKTPIHNEARKYGWCGLERPSFCVLHAVTATSPSLRTATPTGGGINSGIATLRRFSCSPIHQARIATGSLKSVQTACGLTWTLIWTSNPATKETRKAG